MAINACSINSFTIDAGRCRNKFADLIPILHSTITTGSPFLGWVDPAKIQSKQRIAQRWIPPEAPRFDPVENDKMTVAVEIFGLTGSDTQAVMARQDLVTITDIFIEPTTLGVNIMNFKVTQDDKPNDD